MRFRASNYQSTTRVKPFICTMPMRLDEGWNQIQFNLSDFTRRASLIGCVCVCSARASVASISSFRRIASAFARSQKERVLQEEKATGNRPRNMILIHLGSVKLSEHYANMYSMLQCNQ